MKKIILILFCVIAVLLLVFFVFCLIRNRQTLRSVDQQLFAQGRVPSPLPNGFYSGTAQGYNGSWRGKEFDAGNMKGINVFARAEKERRIYPFRLAVGKGVKDDIDVLQIDYNIDANPFWLRPVLDEVVQTEDGILLGKLQYRIIPQKPFTIIFFRLTPP